MPDDKTKPTEDLSSLTKEELYERATDLGVVGRSTLSKEELKSAVADAEATGGQRFEFETSDVVDDSDATGGQSFTYG